MRKILSVILISLFILTIFTPALAQDNNEEVNITINSLKGTVYRKTDQGFFDFFKTVVWTRILDNSNINVGETIKTDPESMFSLNIGKFNRIEILGDTILSIEEETSSLIQNLSVEKGVVWINTTLDTKEDFKLQINTPSCIISTSQAIFKLEIIRGRTFLYMQTGEAVIEEKITQAKEEISEGELAIVEDKTIKIFDKISETGKDNSVN
ncbi:MAG: FecR domain-containing protein [Halanaerobiales bacterium]|nr:FecR domain-containing protein [Halanaerobiales bacterium]